MKFRKINLKTSSLQTLETEFSRVSGLILKIESELSAIPKNHLSAQSRLEVINRRLRQIELEITELRRVKKPSSGVFGKLFGQTEVTPEAMKKILMLRNESDCLQEEEIIRRGEASVVSSKQSSLLTQRKWLKTLEEAIGRRRRKIDSLNELKAAAATTEKRSRQVGASIRKQLEHQSNCPYCGGQLGETPHADHIYPVAKGGRSTPRNMVWVCADCNLKKGKLTLTGFIRKFQLDRARIERHLDNLKKDY
jgi:5-methylcytosine-specific restriction endonuclease McrA